MTDLNLIENMESLFKSLENFTQTEGIIGKPVVQENKTFLPVVSITMGYGGGGGSMKGQNSTAAMGANSASGTGAMGLAAKLCTDGIIVIDGQNVSLLPMSGAGAASSLIDKIPQINLGYEGSEPRAGGRRGNCSGCRLTAAIMHSIPRIASLGTRYFLFKFRCIKLLYIGLIAVIMEL